MGRSFQGALPQPAKCRRSTAASALASSSVRCNPTPPSKSPLSAYSQRTLSILSAYSQHTLSILSACPQHTALAASKNVFRDNSAVGGVQMNPMDLSGTRRFFSQKCIFGPTVAWGVAWDIAHGLRTVCARFAHGLRTACARLAHGLRPARPQGPGSRFPKDFANTFQKMKNDPTQICPLGTHEQQIFTFLFETFPRDKTGGAFFLR